MADDPQAGTTATPPAASPSAGTTGPGAAGSDPAKPEEPRTVAVPVEEYATVKRRIEAFNKLPPEVREALEAGREFVPPAQPPPSFDMAQLGMAVNEGYYELAEDARSGDKRALALLDLKLRLDGTSADAAVSKVAPDPEMEQKVRAVMRERRIADPTVARELVDKRALEDRIAHLERRTVAPEAPAPPRSTALPPATPEQKADAPQQITADQWGALCADDPAKALADRRAGRIRISGFD